MLRRLARRLFRRPFYTFIGILRLSAKGVLLILAKRLNRGPCNPDNLRTRLPCLLFYLLTILLLATVTFQSLCSQEGAHGAIIIGKAKERRMRCNRIGANLLEWGRGLVFARLREMTVHATVATLCRGGERAFAFRVHIFHDPQDRQADLAHCS